MRKHCHALRLGLFFDSVVSAAPLHVSSCLPHNLLGLLFPLSTLLPLDNTNRRLPECNTESSLPGGICDFPTSVDLYRLFVHPYCVGNLSYLRHRLGDRNEAAGLREACALLSPAPSTLQTQWQARGRADLFGMTEIEMGLEWG